MLQGAMTAMVTPFRAGGVDFDRLAANVRFQIDNGIDALVPVGTTGESPTLSHDEHRQVIEKVVEAAAGQTLVVAGTGSNSTEEALQLTGHAKKVGADAALMVSPYYNKPTQEGLYRHFTTVADRIDLPIALYNIPGFPEVKRECRPGLLKIVGAKLRQLGRVQQADALGRSEPHLVAVDQNRPDLLVGQSIIRSVGGEVPGAGIQQADASLQRSLVVLRVGPCRRRPERRSRKIHRDDLVSDHAVDLAVQLPALLSIDACTGRNDESYHEKNGWIDTWN